MRKKLRATFMKIALRPENVVGRSEDGRNIVHIVTRKTIQRASRDHVLVEKCIHSQLTAEMTQEDPDIQAVPDLLSIFAANKRPKGNAPRREISATLGKESTCGLTRGNEIAEEMQTPWNLSASSEHNSGMQDFTDLTYTSIPQHKDSTEACIKGYLFDL
ncbi:hypothetical protein DPMN_143598 [Dreissena polymorpha]|uniref:Uncharacterized protein n=1 Tax=Dreissena polymorpha TaxID=45954 RepID=A0A9D4GDC4_DREPO|nr:hypothetical protein DPMN_143598 [Dreissena polymorpha]